MMQRWISFRRSAGLRGAFLAAVLVSGLGSSSALAAAESSPLVLLIQPILDEQKTREAYQPLCDFIGALAKRECTVRAMPNFLAYWDVIRRNQGYDFVLDAAHFTDYRTQKFNFAILAKIPETVSYSLIVPEGNLVFDPAELVGKTVATLGPPSIGAARLNAMYPNPVRQPTIVEVASAEAGLDLIDKKRVQGAILPTPIVSQRMSTRGGIAVVMTTEPIPHMALSAAPWVDGALRERVRIALLEADKNNAGQKMLQGIGFPRFEPAGHDVYNNQGRILKEYWGY